MVQKVMPLRPKEPIHLFGVDNEFLYLENVKTYVKTMQVEEAARPFLAELEKSLEQLKSNLYSKELSSFLQMQEKLQTKGADSLEYIRQLLGLIQKYKISLKFFPAFNRLQELQAYQEKIQLSQVPYETKTLIEESLLPELSEVDTKALAFHEMDLKAGRISEKEFFTFLWDLAIRYRLDFQNFTNLNLYLNYLLLVDTIDTKKLTKERVKIEVKILNKLLDTKETNKLYQLSKNLKRLQNLLNIKATPEDIRYLKKNKKVFKNEIFFQFLKEHNITLPKSEFSIEANLPLFEKFYRLAEQREKYMVRNTLGQMKTQGIQAAILVTGGYHTPGLKKCFLEEQASYLVLTPRILELPKEDLYRKIMQSYEKEFFGVKEGDTRRNRGTSIQPWDTG